MDSGALSIFSTVMPMHPTVDDTGVVNNIMTADDASYFINQWFMYLTMKQSLVFAD